jgi:hypothetical protein
MARKKTYPLSLIEFLFLGKDMNELANLGTREQLRYEHKSLDYLMCLISTLKVPNDFEIFLHSLEKVSSCCQFVFGKCKFTNLEIKDSLVANIGIIQKSQIMHSMVKLWNV